MRTHRAEKVHGLLQHLPHGYSSIIVNKAKEKGRIVSSSWVRHVRNFTNADLQLLNFLIELAKENKADAEAEKEKLIELTTNT